MALTPSQAAKAKADFDRDGFVCLKGFLAPDEVGELQQQLDRYISQIVPTLEPTEAFYEIKGQPETLKHLHRMEKHDPSFRRMIEDQRFFGLAQTLLGCPASAISLAWFNKAPRLGAATPPHQDGYYWMLEPNIGCTMWLAMDHVDTENGCVRYVPGSHLRGVLPHNRTKTLGFSQGLADFTAADRQIEVACPAAPGDLLIHHGLTIHRADANNSNRQRRAFGLVYYAAHAKPDKARQAAYEAVLNRDLAATGKI